LHYDSRMTIAPRWLLSVFVTIPLLGSDLVEGDFKSNLVPNPVPYAVLMPDGAKDGPPLPLLFYLHGGGGSRAALNTIRGVFDELWKSGRLPKMIVVTPSVTERCFYMDYKDGTEKWESLIVGPLREFIQKTYNASPDPKKNMLMGPSMGGMGSLRMGFKYPEKYLAIAALEPGIEPILHWKDMQPRHRFWRADSLFESAFGKPVDPEYWEANNPSSIAKANPKRLIDSGIQIYIDAGDHDMFLLNEGTEFLHRIMTDNGIEHEYHLVHGADHVGRTLRPRSIEALEFLTRSLNPPGPDPAVENARKTIIEPAKKRFGIK
jgi:S-formylglutathione hydrolase